MITKIKEFIFGKKEEVKERKLKPKVIGILILMEDTREYAEPWHICQYSEMNI